MKHGEVKAQKQNYLVFSQTLPNSPRLEFSWRILSSPLFFIFTFAILRCRTVLLSEHPIDIDIS